MLPLEGLTVVTLQHAHFVWTNRSKESVTLDVNHPDGAAALQRLMPEKADVVVQNLAPGAAARLGLGSDPPGSRRCTRRRWSDVTGPSDPRTHLFVPGNRPDRFGEGPGERYRRRRPRPRGRGRRRRQGRRPRGRPALGGRGHTRGPRPSLTCAAITGRVSW
jgi:hypothetical protein